MVSWNLGVGGSGTLYFPISLAAVFSEPNFLRLLTARVWNLIRTLRCKEFATVWCSDIRNMLFFYGVKIYKSLLPCRGGRTTQGRLSVAAYLRARCRNRCCSSYFEPMSSRSLGIHHVVMTRDGGNTGKVPQHLNRVIGKLHWILNFVHPEWPLVLSFLLYWFRSIVQLRSNMLLQSRTSGLPVCYRRT
jgi:hypothetical protein